MPKWTFDQITEVITREVMTEYEELRRLGTCNMFDTACVVGNAEWLGFDALAAVYENYYSLIWRSFDRLMKHYDISENR